VEDFEKNPQQYADYLATHPKYPTWIEDAKAAVPDKLNQRLGWMTRIHPVMTSPTRMMLPLYSDRFACSLAAFTEDSGETWSFSEPILNINVQACFVPKKNGEIVAFMRDRGAAKRIPRAVSADGGITWSHTEMTELPNPDSSVDCIVLESGRWAMVCNDTEGGARGGRNQLAVLLSEDEGATWTWKRHLEMHGEECAASYPTVIQAADGMIHCTYTYSPSPNETIRHARFNEAWVMEAE
jgi:predicted neuraminidase